MPDKPDRKDERPKRFRAPDELLHRFAHQAATRAAEKHIGKITWAYETMFWDDAAKQALAAFAGSPAKGKFLDPEDAAEMAAQYADALVEERRKRISKSERRGRR